MEIEVGRAGERCDGESELGFRPGRRLCRIVVLLQPVPHLRLREARVKPSSRCEKPSGSTGPNN